jgi:transketolase
MSSMSTTEPISLDGRSLHLRRLVVNALVKGGRGHVGPAMSLIEIMRVLYDDILNVKPSEPEWPYRDRCILSKGHGCLALYALLADKGFFPEYELDRFCAAGGILGGHPEHGKVPGVEASTGALGHGLSIGLGMALACRMQGRNSRVFVVMGDGEINEGAVWEAAMTASKHGLSNLTAIIDCNGLQSYGPTADVLEMGPMADKWRAFGFETTEVNGHDVAALRDVLSSPSTDKPTAVICHTVKGRGIPLAENNAAWHHKSKLKPEELSAISDALGEA